MHLIDKSSLVAASQSGTRVPRMLGQTPSGAAPGADERPMKILAADDKESRDLLCEVLSASDCLVDAVENVAAARREVGTNGDYCACHRVGK